MPCDERLPARRHDEQVVITLPDPRLVISHPGARRVSELSVAGTIISTSPDPRHCPVSSTAPDHR
ncbi:hypothetical protein EAS64_19730 [Trebonia kvetii]|uniref:Uncharacterized protein n=1 Tax=Trebonia kvetii TaxID=2480626 RepID=A0A6P2BZR0_9ACTN|nr:hypothetical protein [Trebonia kvetii]TVZ04584.1 hypothetical protein EAS64_19730 [Trebonia kvetii]